MRSYSLLAVGAAGILFLAGCSGDWGNVAGKVTVDGKPLEKGVVTLHPMNDGPAAYGQVQDGSFTVSTGQKAGVAAGSYKVTVAATTIPRSGTKEKAQFLTPPKYATPKTSDLKAEVKPGGNTLELDLKSRP